jgi:photosystem II stability/assembly factor-like uncharacterized protein
MREVALNPENPSEIYACVDDGHGLYQSTDGGEQWTRVSLGAGSARTYTFAPSNPQVRFASFGTWGTSGGFYRTTNGGSVWVETGGSVINDTVIDVAIHPTDPDIIIAGTSGGGLYRSADGGVSWERVGGSLSDSTFYSVAFAPSNPEIVYAGGYVWIYRSSDGGETWSNADSGFPSYYVDGLAIHPSDPEWVLAGSNRFPHGGVYKRTSDAGSFSLKATGMTDTFVLDIEQDPKDTDTLYVATWGAGVFRSDDGGRSWNPRYVAPYVYTIHAAEGPTGTILYAGTFYSNDGIFKSYDRGDTWTEVSWDYPSYISFDITSIYDDPDRLIAATFAGMQYSYDGGESWYDSKGLSDGIVLHLCEFSGTGRMLAATYGGGLFYSWGGYSWYEANTGVPKTHREYQYTYDIACSPDVEGIAYAGGLGVYRTYDYGEHWHVIDAGLPNDYVRAIDIVPGTGDVFAGTNQNGAYLAPNGIPIWSPINTGLVEKRVRSIKAVSDSPVRAVLGSNGMGTWDYTLTARPNASSVYLPVTLRNLTPLPCHSYESNNDFETARTLSSGTHCSYISHVDDEDYYQFDIQTLGQIDIELTHIPEGADYDVTFYNEDFDRLMGSYRGSNDPEEIRFQPRETGHYYMQIYSFKGSSSDQGYHISLSYNRPRADGEIHGTLTDNGEEIPGVPVVLRYYNGYRTGSIATLTDGSGAYHFYGMPTLPVGHYYQIYYPNYESNSGRLAYWYGNSIYGYQAGDISTAGSFDVDNVDLLAPAWDTDTDFPVTFQWETRGLTEDYELYLRRYDPSYAYYYSPFTSIGSYTLNTLPSSFSYGDTNYWSVNLYSNGGHGASYYRRSITFSNLMTQQESPAPSKIPNCPDEYGEKGCVWRQE